MSAALAPTPARYVPAQPPFDVSRLSLTALRDLFVAYEAAEDAFQAIVNMPRTSRDATDLVEVECERCSDFRQALAQEAERRRPVTLQEQETRGEILVRWGLECGSWQEIGIAFVEVTTGGGH